MHVPVFMVMRRIVTVGVPVLMPRLVRIIMMMFMGMAVGRGSALLCRWPNLGVSSRESLSTFCGSSPGSFLLEVFLVNSHSDPCQLPRLISLTCDQDIHLGCRDSTAIHFADLQLRAYAQRCDGILEQGSRDARVHQRAEEHVAADAGKTL